MKKFLLPVLILTVIAAGLILFFKLKPAAKVTYNKAVVDRGTISESISCTGTVEFTRTETVTALTSGILRKLYADFNSRIRKGQTLAVLDDSVTLLSLKEAEAAYDQAKATLTQAEKDYSSTKQLFEEQFKTQSELDAAQTTLQSARTALKTAETALEKAGISQSYTRVTSPLTGIVVNRAVDNGAYVTAGTALFTVAADTSRMQILGAVDESDIAQVKVGQKVKFTVQAQGSRQFSGRVSQIRLQPSTVQNVVSYTVVVDADNRQNLLLPGMTATLDIITSEKENVLRVPAAALKFRPSVSEIEKLPRPSAQMPRPEGQNTGGTGMTRNGARNGQTNDTSRGMVWILNDTTGKLRPVFVRTGLSDGQYTEVESRMLTESNVIVTGKTTAAKKTTGSRSPFQPQRGPGAMPGGPGPR